MLGVKWGGGPWRDQRVCGTQTGCDTSARPAERLGVVNKGLFVVTWLSLGSSGDAGLCRHCWGTLICAGSSPSLISPGDWDPAHPPSLPGRYLTCSFELPAGIGSVVKYFYDSSSLVFFRKTQLLESCDVRI